ncbi:MAG TPA: Gfo/Idh/MocA family oxidoreductase [Bryobacteraceae bacterium]|nr:Gfo/Idh/MocA family oxidoreductase [Bryobacteraceae bacterium]
MRNVSRRSFVISLAAASRVLGANNDIRLGVIGVGSTVKGGGRGKADARSFRRIPGVRVMALCDPDHANLDPEVEQFAKDGYKVEAYTDLRKLLDNKDIDAVCVTTPNHWHALAAIWACQAGKDVYVEKPASHTIFEGRKMVEAARKYGRIVSVTSNSRSPTGFREALQYAFDGNLGKIRYVYGLDFNARTSIGKVSGPQPIPKSIDYDLWSGPAPIAPVMRQFLHYDWHWIWSYGNGDVGNMGIHSMDGCRMAVRQDALPKHVMSFGGRFAYDDDGQTPNTQLIFLDYQPAPIIYEVRGLPHDKSLLSTAWNQNYKETMDSYRGVRIGVVVQCEGGYIAANGAFEKNGTRIREFKSPNPTEQVAFIQAVRSRKETDLAGDILQGHLSASLVHLGNISYRLGKVTPPGEIQERIGGRQELRTIYESLQERLRANGVDLNQMVAGPMLTMDSDTERFTGAFSKEANRFVSRTYRKPFVVPEKV